MIKHILRLFSVFRRLEHELSQSRSKASDYERLFLREADERKKADTERDFWKDQCLTSQKESRELRDRMIEESHKIADVMSIHAIGKRVFSKADPIPVPQGEQNRQPVGRQSMRAMQAAQTERTRQQFEAMMREIAVKTN